MVQLVRPKLPSTCTLLYQPESDAYPAVIDRFSDGFDVIVVDGLVKGRTRLKCVRAAVRRLREGGMIILDNSDCLPESSRLLRESGLIEVDMTGFAPINDYSCTTSFYFHRGFGFKPLTDRQPMPGIGAHRTTGSAAQCKNGSMRPDSRKFALTTPSPEAGLKRYRNCVGCRPRGRQFDALVERSDADAPSGGSRNRAPRLARAPGLRPRRRRGELRQACGARLCSALSCSISP